LILYLLASRQEQRWQAPRRRVQAVRHDSLPPKRNAQPFQHVNSPNTNNAIINRGVII